VAFVPVPDTVHVRFSGTTGAANRPWTFGLYFKKEGFDESDLDDLLSYLETWADDLMGEDVWTGYKLNHIEATDLTSEDGIRKGVDIDASGDSSQETPRGMGEALVLSFAGNKRGKWNAGRVYLPLLNEGDVDEYDINSGFAEGIRDVFREFLTDLPAGWVWVVVSRVLHGQKRTTGVVAPIVECVIKKYIIGTQRRRLRRNRS
jgi:hypothetical protein